MYQNYNSNFNYSRTLTYIYLFRPSHQRELLITGLGLVAGQGGYLDPAIPQRPPNTGTAQNIYIYIYFVFVFVLNRI